MNSINKVTLIGNLGANPKVLNTGKGEKFASFSLATHDSWKDKDGNKQQDTQWHQVVVFNSHLAAFIEEYVRKGDLVYIEGKLKTKEIIKDQDHVSKKTEIVLSEYSGELVLLSKKDIPIDQSEEAVA